MNYTPVFIIGAGRSGTKYLRDVLSASSAVVCIPYDVGFIWRTGSEMLAHDEIDFRFVPEKSIVWMRGVLPTLIDRSVSKKEATLLIEKSVPNSLRPLLLYRAFPNAMFIHLVRDGRAVTESALRMWQTPANVRYLIKKIRYFPIRNFWYGLFYVRNFLWSLIRGVHPTWGPRYNGIDKDFKKEPLHVVCARQWFHCVDVSFRQLSQIPKNQVILVRYEDIMEGTDTLEKICAALKIDSTEVLNYHLANRRTGENKKWRHGLSEDMQKDISAVFEGLQPSMKEFVFGEKSNRFH